MASNSETCIVGYTTRKHLILDLDRTHNLYETKKLIQLVQEEYHELGCCLLCESSKHGYHTIFDNKISWKRIMHISKVLYELRILNRNYIKIRNFREDLTLRISSVDRGEKKSEAPNPIILILCAHCRNGIIFPHNVNLQSVLSSYDASKFSGICEYLICLSVFREILNVPIL